MEATWQQGVKILDKTFSPDIAEMTRLFQDYSCNPRQFDSIKDIYLSYPQFVSIAGRQLDIRSFTDFVKRTERFPATECA
jgi:hypothetical protein